MVAKQGGDRHARRRRLGHGGGEGGRLGEIEAHPQAEPDEQRAREEGQAPAPVAELIGREQDAQRQEQPVGGDEAHRRAKLRHHAEARAPAGRRILHREQCRAAPFAAEAESLREPQGAQEQRRDPSGGLIGGEESDRGGRSAHQQERGDERGLAADPIPEMPEHARAERAGEEGKAEARISREKLHRGRRGREEKRPEDERGGGGVDIEIVEFHSRADEARQQDTAGGGSLPLVEPSSPCRPAVVAERLEAAQAKVKRTPDFPLPTGERVAQTWRLCRLVEAG